MKRLLYIGIALVSIVANWSCERTELIYQYNPYCDVTFNTDWSSLSEAPSGMSIYCYPQPSGTPTVLRTNSINSATMSLETGVYNVVIFNQDIYDYESVGFRNITDFSTFEIYASTTTSMWVEARADSRLVVDPAEIAVSTIEGVEITEEQTNISVQMYHETGSRYHAATYDVEPEKVVKNTGVRIAVNGFTYMASVKATIAGMSEGYNVGTQLSLEAEVTHILESWTATQLSEDDNTGEITIAHNNFGLPLDSTLTRVDDDWEGTLYVYVILVDGEIYEKTYDLNQSHFVKSKSGGYDLYVDMGDDALDLPEAYPMGSEGGWDAEVDVWEYEEVVDLFL